MADPLSSVSRSGAGSSSAGGQPQMNAFQQKSVSAVAKAIQSGQVNDPKLSEDLKAVQQAQTPEELHKAIHQLRQDAKKDGIEMPQKAHSAGAHGAGGKGGAEAANELGPDDLNVAGDELKKPATGSQFGYNGGDGAFGGNSFQMGGRKLGFG
jgi:hypothetical protein